MRATNESVVIARHINAFLNEYVPSQKTRSAHTLKAYSDGLSLYVGFLETEKGIKASTLNGACFCAVNIEEWLVWLMESRTCSPETCNNRLASLRAFLKYLGGRDVSYLHLSQGASQIERRKAHAKKVTGMSKKAVSALLEAPDPTTKAGRRDIALMVVMYSTAARIDEILSMKVEQLHLDVDKPNITVIGKRGKIRTLYLLPKATAHLRAYIKDFHGSAPNPSSFVFYSRNTGSTGKMSQNAVNKQLRKHAQVARSVCDEVPTDIHAHQLRHAKASHWLEDGMNIVQISFLLGHAQLQTTMVYLDITTEQEAKALATLEDDNDKSTPKKWRNADGTLSMFCGVRAMKR
ncbi:tyrosine-type recombinase/integrase [Desulfoscipio sp. XC116]|uniref:tyrosine-type recombinase/integrase n=1 Tax=Desulfoscipio sp. XC116 TaxID=3144975 RepID=UPI00325A49E5